jgi:rod shape-determining protein MreB
MFKRLFETFSNNIAIDLGTSNTLVYMQGNLILDEPSMVALIAGKSGEEKKILAIGKEAREMLGKTPKEIEVIRPMKDGVIADFHITEQMIKLFIKKASKFKRMISMRTNIVISVPYGSTQVERRAIKNTALAVGAHRVEIIEKVMAAAIGAGLPIESPNASIVVDIGGGTTEVGVISLGGLVYAGSIRVAGDRMDEVIANYIRSKHGLLIGSLTAERIKTTIGSAHSSIDSNSMEIHGRNLFDGLHKKLTIDSAEICDALGETLSQITTTVKQALEATPPELSEVLLNSGIFLTGGVSLLSGLDKLLSEVTQLKVTVAEEPLRCVAKGCVMAMNYGATNKIYINKGN